MKQNFEQCTDWVLVHEGGYVNHPKDPGGATNRGVIQRTYDGYRDRMGLRRQSVRLISDAEVMQIYKEQYWDAIHGDLLPDGLDYAMYDFAINSGPSRANKFLQSLVHVEQDGQIGNVTLGAIRGHNNLENLVKELCLKRWNWMKRLKTFKTFGRGWTARVMGKIVEGVQPGTDHGVIDRAVWMVQGKNNIPATKFIHDANHKAEEDDIKLTSATYDSFNIDNIGKIAAGVVPGAIGSAAALPEGPLQWTAAGIAGFAAFIAGILIVRKMW